MPRVFLAASPGGHIQLLRSIADAFEGYQRTWVTAPGAHADSLVQEGERVVTLSRVRGVAPREIAKNLRGAVALAVRERPELVVTSGADLVVPFCLASRSLGARLVFIETMARVTSRSRASRILRPLADAEFVQWDERRRGDRTQLIWPPYFERLESAPALSNPEGVGTFVTVGTHTAPFERLAVAVEDAARDRVLPGPVRIQHGYTRSPTVAERESSEAWWQPQAMHAALESAQIVVAHAGAGAIFAALQAGHRPLVMARSARFGEHVDDHQRELVQKLDLLDLVVPVESNITPEHVQRALARPLQMPQRPPSVPRAGTALRGVLRPNTPKAPSTRAA